MYQRNIANTLRTRLLEPRKFMQVIMGPRQTGKTTAAKQALEASGLPYVSFDAAASRSYPLEQLRIRWEQARTLAKKEGGATLFVDEAQKIPDWQDTVKALWDEDTWNDVPLRVVISGSSSLLLRKGLADSLKGRFEVLRSTQWFFQEMKDAFGYTLEDFLHFGGYPGAAALYSDENRWLAYMKDSVIESTISNDVLQLETIRKPALLRRIFEMGSYYSGQEFSYRKILGQLDDKGNTDTIAHYLDLLSTAGMLTGLQKHSAKEYRTRKSSPRFAVYDTAIMTTAWADEADRLFGEEDVRGHLIESAVGAYLLNLAALDRFEVRWWRDGNNEVDFVLRKGKQVTAIEVKSSRVKKLDGLAAFLERFPDAKPLVVGDSINTLESFLAGEVDLF